jgi:septin family protein
MVCGASGIGKTSFIELFMRKLNKVEYFESIKTEVTKYSPMHNGNYKDGKIYNMIGNKGPTEDWPESSLESL